MSIWSIQSENSESPTENLGFLAAGEPKSSQFETSMAVSVCYFDVDTEFDKQYTSVFLYI